MRMIASCLVTGMALLASTAAYGLSCAPFVHWPTGTAIAGPDNDGYDPLIYAHGTYDWFSEAFEDPDQIVLMGILIPTWDTEKPLPHSNIQPPTGLIGEGELHYSMMFDYAEAYDFEGVQITAGGRRAI